MKVYKKESNTDLAYEFLIEDDDAYFGAHNLDNGFDIMNEIVFDLTVQFYTFLGDVKSLNDVKKTHPELFI